MYLTSEQLSNLNSYKYSSVDRSFLSRYILNPFWNQLVLLFPLWMAPNLITLIGLCFMISAVLLTYALPPTPLLYLYIAFCISTYLNMDSIDGKQARRTGTSGPLGELFDHGCDAINMMLMAVLIPFIFGLPLSHPHSIAMALFGYAAFYASTWEEYHTGTLYLDYISGPTEGAWSVVLASFVTFLTGGTEIWAQEIIYGWSAKDVVPVIFILGAIFTILTALRHSRPFHPKEWIMPVIYFTSCALLAVVTSAHMNMSMSMNLNMNLNMNLINWFIFLTGFPACFRISSTIIAHVTKSPLRTCSFYPIEYIPSFLFLTSYLLPIHLWSSLFKFATFAAFFVYYTAMLLIISDICNHLNISCLTIKKKVP